MAINGDGFFTVQKPTGITDNVPVFNGVTDYTRRGDFQLNANGNLVNGAGYYLMGVAVDPKTGNPIGNVPQVLQFQNNFIPAQATTTIQYAANLPTTPTTAASTTVGRRARDGCWRPQSADFSRQSAWSIGTPADALHRRHRRPAARSTTSSRRRRRSPARRCSSGAAGTDSLTSNFAAGDTITVDGTTPINFVSTGAARPAPAQRRSTSATTSAPC